MNKKMSKKKIVLLCILAVVVIALLIVVIGYIRGWFDKGYDADVVTVSQRNVTSTFETSGTVASSKEGTFGVVSGIKVEKVNVKVGSVVKKGDVLASFDSSSLNSALKEKQDSLNKAQKAYNDYKAGIISAKTQLADIENKIAQAEAKVAKLEKEAAEAEKAAAEAEEKAKQEAEEKKTQDSAANAEQNLSKLIDDSTLAGKIIRNLIGSVTDLDELEKMLSSISSMGNMAQFPDIMGSMTQSSSQYELMQAQLELATLKASKTVSETQSNGSLEGIYKSVYEESLNQYNQTKAVIDSLNAGWIAEYDGVVSEVSIKAGETIMAEGAKSAASFDASSIVSAIMSGGDVSKLISGFFSQGSTGIKVQYYPLEIKFMLNKGDLKDVKVGLAAKVKSETGEYLDGKVTFIAAVATSSSSVDLSALMGGTGGSGAGIEAVVSVDKPDGGIIIGLDADVSIDIEEKQNCITVPVESIQYDDSHAYVYTYNAGEGTISKKTVETGIFDGTYYEILSGIEPGEVIVRTPVSTMNDGDKVIAHNVDKGLEDSQ